jgi:hypothetical protein
VAIRMVGPASSISQLSACREALPPWRFARDQKLSLGQCAQLRARLSEPLVGLHASASGLLRGRLGPSRGHLGLPRQRVRLTRLLFERQDAQAPLFDGAIPLRAFALNRALVRVSGGSLTLSRRGVLRGWFGAPPGPRFADVEPAERVYDVHVLRDASFEQFRTCIGPPGARCLEGFADPAGLSGVDPDSDSRQNVARFSYGFSQTRAELANGGSDLLRIALFLRNGRAISCIEDSLEQVGPAAGDLVEGPRRSRRLCRSRDKPGGREFARGPQRTRDLAPECNELLERRAIEPIERIGQRIGLARWFLRGR